MSPPETSAATPDEQAAVPSSSASGSRRSLILPVILRRLAIMVPTLFGIVTITFILTRALGGNPARQIAGQAADEETVARISAQYGFDKPLIVQYWDYLTGLLQGSLGTSTQTNQPVLTDLVDKFPATLEIVILSILLALLIGVPLGAWAGRTASNGVKGGIRILTFIFLAIPDFWLALVAVYIFFFQLRVLPGPTGQSSIDGEVPNTVTGANLLDSVLTGNVSAFADSFSHAILPVAVLGILMAAPITRLMRSSTLVVMESDYVKFGTAAGLPRITLWRYVVRGAIPSVITFTGTLFTMLLGGVVLIETVFSWGGAAQYAANAIQRSDFAATQGFVLICGVLAMIVFLIIDLIQLTIDPRVRTAYVSGGGGFRNLFRRRASASESVKSKPVGIEKDSLSKRFGTALADVGGVLREMAAMVHPRRVGTFVADVVRQRNIQLLLGSAILLVMIAAAFIVPALSSQGVREADALNSLSKPSADHWFGTDGFGFDIFVRVVYAARTDLSIAALGVILSAIVGIALGIIIGFSRRAWLDNVAMRIVDMIQSFPVLIVAVALVAFAGNSLTNVVWALVFINVPIFLRLARTQVHTIRELRYIEAAKAAGSSRARTLLRHVLPNAMAPAIVQVGLQMGYAIVTVAGLAFLGVGIQAPTPEWGSMILSGKDNIVTGQWWTVVFPGLAVLVAVAAFNLIAEGVERARDIYR
jgi:peptide/nickel transport system permease protein